MGGRFNWFGLTRRKRSRPAMTIRSCLGLGRRHEWDDRDPFGGCGDDAVKWATAFQDAAVRFGYPKMDHAWLVAWFANAIEHASDIRLARKGKEECLSG